MPLQYCPYLVAFDFSNNKLTDIDLSTHGADSAVATGTPDVALRWWSHTNESIRETYYMDATIPMTFGNIDNNGRSDITAGMSADGRAYFRLDDQGEADEPVLSDILGGFFNIDRVSGWSGGDVVEGNNTNHINGKILFLDEESSDQQLTYTYNTGFNNGPLMDFATLMAIVNGDDTDPVYYNAPRRTRSQNAVKSNDSRRPMAKSEISTCSGSDFDAIGALVNTDRSKLPVLSRLKDTGASADFNSASFFVNWNKSSVVTGITDVRNANANVVKVTYVNSAGIESDRPHDGFNIVRRVMSDGTVQITKAIK